MNWFERVIYKYKLLNFMISHTKKKKILVVKFILNRHLAQSPERFVHSLNVVLLRMP